MAFLSGRKGRGPMNFGATNADFLLTSRVSDDVNVVPHIRKRVGHLPDARGGAVIGGERTGRYHGDRVAGSVPPTWRSLSHVVVTGDLRYGLTGWREMIRAGTPNTVQLLGTSAITTEFALTTTLSPTGHASHHLTSGTEINIIADGWPAGPADTSNAHALINCATVADLLG